MVIIIVSWRYTQPVCTIIWVKVMVFFRWCLWTCYFDHWHFEMPNSTHKKPPPFSCCRCVKCFSDLSHRGPLFSPYWRVTPASSSYFKCSCADFVNYRHNCISNSSENDSVNIGSSMLELFNTITINIISLWIKCIAHSVQRFHSYKAPSNAEASK